MALARIGGAEEDETIASFTSDQGKTAGWCRIFYPHCLGLVCERWDFHETSAYGDLGAELSGSSVPENAEWEYAFNLPSDFFGMVKQTNEEDHTQSYDYQIQKGILYTNTLSNSDEDSAYIEYVTKEDDTGKYTFTMIEALVVLLASKLAGPVAKDDEQAQALLQEYEVLALPTAKAANQRSKAEPDQQGETSWLNARTRSRRGTSCTCGRCYCCMYQ
jgi:hypothetical protein